MKIIKYSPLIIFMFFLLEGSIYSQSFYRTYTIPTGNAKIPSTGSLIIPTDSNQIALLGSWESDYSFSLLTNSHGDTICSHGDFLPTGYTSHLYGIGGFFDLLEIPGGYVFIEIGCEVHIGPGDWSTEVGIIFMDNRMHVKNINILTNDQYGSLRSPNLYNYDNSVIFTGTPWGYSDTAYQGGPFLVPLYAPIWRLDTNGNKIWTDNFGSPYNESQIFNSIITLDSNIAVLGIIPAHAWIWNVGTGPDTVHLKLIGLNGNIKADHISTFVPNVENGHLVELKKNILIIGNVTDISTKKQQLCIETVDSKVSNIINQKKYIINNDTGNVNPLSVFKATDSTAWIRYQISGSAENYYLLVNSNGDSLQSFSLPPCSNVVFDNGNFLCETDTNNTFVVKEYAPGGSIVYKYGYNPGTFCACNNIEPLPKGKGKFIMTGEVNDTLFIIRQDTQIINLSIHTMPESIPKIAVYPNPAINQITFQLSAPGNQGWSVEIYDVMGRNILNEKFAKPTETINCSGFSNGVYFYRVSDANGNLINTGKVVVIH